MESINAMPRTASHLLRTEPRSGNRADKAHAANQLVVRGAGLATSHWWRGGSWPRSRLQPRAFALEKVPAWLTQTAAARAAVKRYVAPIGELDEPKYLEHRLERLADDAGRREAARIADAPVHRIRSADRVYHAAALALVLLDEAVEGRPRPFWGENPLKNPEMMYRLQLTATT
jgi:hypothetical protein